MSNEVKKGDTPDPRKSPGGEQRPASHDREFVRQMRHAEEIMRDDREVLVALAK